MATKQTCKAKDCGRELFAKGYCRKHYRLWKAGEMPRPRYKICTFEKCRKPRGAKGSLCDEHWTTAHSKAPEAGAAAAPAPAAEAPAS